MLDNHSNTRIKKLSPLLINQLAAGEVVTRPSAVVKELLENAIDAGASNIEVHITQGGMGMIEVVDNGVGIHPDDMVMAITRHATSKVADVANLHGITTLGFRGEALAATAAVSRLTLTSSHDDSGIGRQLQVTGILDDLPKLIPVVHNRGTTITVKDLYFNVPARRGNLKSISTEFSHIETIVREVALARADVALSLFHDNKKRLSLSSALSSSSLSINVNGKNNNASRLPLSRLEQATGRPLTDNALEVAIDLSSLMQQPIGHADNHYSGNQVSISGWLWPSTDSQDALPKLLYVNGRLVKEPIVSNQLRQLAHSAGLSSIGYALYFDLPTEWLNINVHPSKQRIKISPLNNIMAHLSHAVRLKLKTVSTTETVATTDYDKQTLDRNTSPSTSFNASLPKTFATSNLAQSNQVHAPKYPYQLSASKQFSKNSAEFYSAEYYIDESSDKNVKPSSATSADSLNILNSSFIKTGRLPVCLDVINSLNGLVSESSNPKDIDDKSLPWLLFYNQGQLSLISAADWHSKLRLLFESHVLSSNIFKKDEMLNSAACVNQQLAIVSAQMTAQDLTIFIVDVEELLTNNAIKVIDRNQLVSLMLLSASEQTTFS